MEPVRRTGVLGALAAGVASALLHAHRHAEREAETCLCASRLHTLGLALRAYQEDNGGELPRKFIRPLHDRLTTSGWGPDWYEASLADYVIDADAYYCPSGCCYADRTPLLLRDGPQQLLRPEPETVVMYCSHHGTWHPEKRYRQGEYVVLRMSDKVERVPAAEVEPWQYLDGRWYPPEEAFVGASVLLAFPGEPWPPRLETVPVPDSPWVRMGQAQSDDVSA